MTLAHVRTAKFMRTILNEDMAFKKSLAQLTECKGLLGNKPLIVLSAGKISEDEGTGYTKEQLVKMMENWQPLQKDLVTKSTRGKQMIAEKSDHMIPRNQPGIIVDAVREIMRTL